MSASRHGLLLFGEDSLTVTDASGNIVQRLSYREMGLSDGEVEQMISCLRWGEGIGGIRRGDRIAIDWADEDTLRNIRYYDLSNGDIGEMPWEEFDLQDGDPYIDYGDAAYAVENAVRLADEALGSDAPGLLFTQDYGENGLTTRYYRDDGTPIESLTRIGENWYQQVALRGGLIEVLDINTAAYYDLETMDCVFETYLGYEAD